MQTIVSRLGQSASFKAAIVAFLILILLIPTGMIRGVINERHANQDTAKASIMQTWGAEQTLTGPVFVLPYTITYTDEHDRQFTSKKKTYVLPETLNMAVEVQPEIRHRGLFRVPVYRAAARIDGTWSLAGVEDDIAGSSVVVHWREASVAVIVSDARAITKTPVISIGQAAIQFEPGSESIGNLAAPIVATIGSAIDLDGSTNHLDFDFRLELNGTDKLSFLPFGDTTSVTVRSGWASPSFSGSYLPESHQIDDAGFSAEWRVASIGRSLPSRWKTGDNVGALVDQSAFGFQLYMPISLYRLTLRATKYAILFIGLTFVAYFMFEVVAGLRLHPLQYLLVGLANCLFYLLLVSMAEHIGFGLAYLASCAASSGLIVSYSYSVLESRLRAGVMAVLLIVLYAFLYMTLQAEDFALLAGSFGLWVGVALIMYLTRRIDWYATRDEDTETGDSA